MKMNNNCVGLSEKDNQIMNRLKEHYEEIFIVVMFINIFVTCFCFRRAF